MLLTTTDTIPQTFTVLGVVQVAFVASPVHKVLKGREKTVEGSLDWAEDRLIEQAEEVGADGVIGLRIASLFGNNCILMGTAIKLA